PDGDPEKGFEKGKLKFELKGYKLRGTWELIRTGKAPPAGADFGPRETSKTSWLLFKKSDAHAKAGEPGFREESILSGLTVEEMRSGSSRASDVREELVRAGAPARAVKASEVEVMLPETRVEPFSGKDWVFELKYDGFRVVAAKEGKKALLFSRRQHEITQAFPEVARAVAALPYDQIVLDCELVSLDERGRPSFQRLLGRAHLLGHADRERAAGLAPAVLFIFDLLGFAGLDARGLPLLERKRLLQRLLPQLGPLRFSDHVAERGEDFFEEVSKLELEGMVAKKIDSRYVRGRSSSWIKVRKERTGDFVVTGFTAPKGSRSGFGALHLAAWEPGPPGSLLYVGRVGTGFDERELALATKALEAGRTNEAPCHGPIPADRTTVWVEPKLICEVRYKDWTNVGILREPAFLRFREDKKIEECTLEDPTFPGRPPRAFPEMKDAPVPRARSVSYSNLEKVFWPEEGYTKGDLIEYYRKISPWLLPYLRDRPLVLTRFPDGIHGKSFFQHNAPGFVAEWLRTHRLWSEHSGREIEHFICDDEESLLYLVNLGSIPLHIWSSRVGSLEKPDWLTLDLDPKGAPFAHVVEIARALHELCEEVGLPSFAKTSGSTGLHVFVPLAGQLTYEQARTFAALLARAIEQEKPSIATTTMNVQARGGRVYPDFLQNAHGRTLAAPFSARPLPGAPVSTPLRWSEVSARLDPRKHTIATVPARLERSGKDPLLPVLELAPDLSRALEALSRVLEKRGSP
ncbi:DNA ligase D, partial [bacterium]|nr:DNA ligase D [bacterium]